MRSFLVNPVYPDGSFSFDSYTAEERTAYSAEQAANLFLENDPDYSFDLIAVKDNFGTNSMRIFRVIQPDPTKIVQRLNKS